MTEIAQQIAKLAHLQADTNEVDVHEAIHKMRAFRRRCDIAAEWGRLLTEIEQGPVLEALPAQIVRESRKQLTTLQAQIQQALTAANAKG